MVLQFMRRTALGNGYGVYKPCSAARRYINPEEIEICKHDDGTDWLLGTGSYGQVGPQLIDRQHLYCVFFSVRNSP